MTWELKSQGEQLEIKGDKAQLEQYVQTLVNHLQGGKQ